MNVTRNLTSDEYLVTHSVGPGEDGWRLDSFLKDRYRKRSRETLKKAIDSGAISIKREQSPHLTVGRLKPGLTLVTGDEVLVLSERKPEPEVDFNYKLLYEDDVLFVIEKPANLPVHPAGRYFFNTLLIHLRTEGHRNRVLRAEREFFLVHRIDKETSGILVLATDRSVCAHLTKQFAERKTTKRYLAVVKGITPETFQVDLPIHRAKNSLISLKMDIAREGDPEFADAMHASTAFKRLQTAGNYSLVECYPKTGRQHQIRLHLAAYGHPIVGDKLYGLPEEDAIRFFDRAHLTPENWAKLLLPRHALHSSGLGFEHPVSGQMMNFNSELPADLQAFMDEQARNVR